VNSSEHGRKQLTETKAETQAEEVLTQLASDYHDYYLFSDLSNLLNISEKASDGLKSLIMRFFWKEKLTYPLRALHGLAVKNSDVWEDLDCSAFESLLLRFDPPHHDRKEINSNKWDFYHDLFLKAQEGLIRKAYLPFLALHRADLIYVLKKNNFKTQSQKLSALWTAREKQKDETLKRDKKLVHNFEKLKTHLDHSHQSVSELAKVMCEANKKKAGRRKTKSTFVASQTIRRSLTDSFTREVKDFLLTEGSGEELHHKRLEIFDALQDPSDPLTSPFCKKIAEDLRQKHPDGWHFTEEERTIFIKIPVQCQNREERMAVMAELARKIKIIDDAIYLHLINEGQARFPLMQVAKIAHRLRKDFSAKSSPSNVFLLNKK
jgi:hypothetical protein